MILKKNKYWITFLLIAFFPKFSFTQNTTNEKSKKSEKDFYSSFFVHYVVASNIRNKEWTNFVNTYNSVIKPIAPLTNFKTHKSFDIGYKACYKVFFGIISWQHLHLRAEAGFNFNEKRRFDYYNNAITFGGGARVLNVYKQKINVFLTGEMRAGDATRLTSSYIYRDGFESIGGDKTLNGTYLDAGTLGSEWGALLKMKIIKGLNLETKFVYQFNNSVIGSTFTDLSNYKTFSTGGLGVLNLPADYQVYINQGAVNYILTNGSNIKSNFKGFKFCFGLSYLF